MAPNPAHAKETILNIMLLSSHAITTPIMAIARIIIHQYHDFHDVILAEPAIRR